MSKQYGLIVSNKSKSGNHTVCPVKSVKASVFEDDSDSDSGSAKPTGLKTALKRQDRLLQERAIEEDPTVFQYDELYDDMDSKRKESKLSRKDLDKKPKYISKLLASAERRKRENERRIERQVQKEREAEGEEFKDKESFVTSAYRDKLEELKKLEEEEKREEYLEAIGDVKKQGNLDGFYRHLYDQKVLCDDKIDEKIKQEGEEKKENESLKKDGGKKRKYRKRDKDDSDVEDVPKESEKILQHLPSNIDADSDFSIDSSETDEENEGKKEKRTEPSEKEEKALNEEQIKADGIKEESVQKENSIELEEKIENVVVKDKIDIWKKRTVGEVFDKALQRFFERKALREAGTYVRPELM